MPGACARPGSSDPDTSAALYVNISVIRAIPDPVLQGRIASSGVLHHLSEKIPHYGKEHNNFRRDRDLELRQDLARLPGIGGAAELCEQGARDRRRLQHSKANATRASTMR
jgi:hypothetical protein